MYVIVATANRDRVVVNSESTRLRSLEQSRLKVVAESLLWECIDKQAAAQNARFEDLTEEADKLDRFLKTGEAA